MKVFKNPSRSEWNDIIKRPQMSSAGLGEIVRKVLDDIKNRGDAAVREYTEKFDKVKDVRPEVTGKEWEAAASVISNELKSAIHVAVENISKFHLSQVTKVNIIETMPGVRCWQKSTPIEKVGLYIPGGSAPLFSTVLMLAIPAQIAGCKEVILCSPPSSDGTIHPAILYAAGITGVNRIFKVGGVQAIGAMAYGTETIPKMFKIFGPGNQYVTAAKQQVLLDGTAIDMPAGPSEVLVVADKSSNPSFVASDLLAQAEHGTDSHVLLVTRDEEIIEPVMNELHRQLEVLSRKEIARQSIAKSAVILVKDDAELADLINLYGPEHLILSNKDYNQLAERIINAGSVFLGNYTPESAGDYASGTNHTLPTYGYAKAYNGVNLDSYVKKITYQEITREGLLKLGPVIEVMAEAEKLTAHKNAVTLRIKNN